MNLYPELTLNSYFATETLAVWDILVSWIWKAVHANDVASDGEGRDSIMAIARQDASWRATSCPRSPQSGLYVT